MVIVGLVLGLLGGVFGTRRFWPRIVIVREIVRELVTVDAEPDRKRFRIVFDTDEGGRARRAYEALNASKAERTIMYDGAIIRGTRSGD